MAVTLNVYEPGNPTSLGTLVPEKGTFSLSQPAREDGSATLTVKGDTAAALLAEGTYVRVAEGFMSWGGETVSWDGEIATWDSEVPGTDLFAFVPNVKVRRTTPGGATLVDLSGPGVRWWLHKGQVLQGDTSDCAEPADVRHLGWMSQDYDDTGWSTPVTFGTFQSGPWVTARPENWPAPFAEYLGITTDPATPGDFGARATVTLTEDADFIPCASADDEYRVWIDDRLISELDTIGGGPFQWKRWQQRPMRLCAGTHTIAIQVRNLERPLASTNYGWFIFALSPAGSNGNLRSANQIWNVYHDHSAGTFTLTGAFGETTSAIAYNANAATVQAALEALTTVGTGNVTVTGSGSTASPWVIEFGGDIASTYVPLSINGGSLTGGTGAEADEIQRGKTAGSVLKSEPSEWVVKDFSTGVPGMTPGHILRLCLEEIQARGVTVLDHFTLGFSDTLDSDGNAWNVELNLPVSLPADLHRVAVMLEEHGCTVRVRPDLTIDCWDTIGTDLSATVALAVDNAGTVTPTNGATGVAATRDETIVENVLRVRTDEGWTELTDTASVTARGRSESGHNLEGYPSAAEAATHTAPLLDDLSTPVRSTTLTVQSGGSVVPNRDFFLADIIAAPAFGDDGFELVDMRAVHFGARLSEKTLLWTVELID